MIRLPAIAAAIALAVPSLAQVLPSSPHLTLEQRGAFLLAHERVRKTIGVPSATASKIDASLSAYTVKQDRLFAAAKADEDALKALDVETATNILGALPTPQRKKLFQFALQQAGATALQAPDVVKALKLTTAQTAKIGKILEAATEPEQRLEEIIAERMEKAADDAERRKLQGLYANERRRLASLRKEAQAKAFTVLTPAQKKSFSALGK